MGYSVLWTKSGRLFSLQAPSSWLRRQHGLGGKCWKHQEQLSTPAQPDGAGGAFQQDPRDCTYHKGRRSFLQGTQAPAQIRAQEDVGEARGSVGVRAPHRVPHFIHFYDGPLK